jgi:hypothetical protein
MRRSGAIAVSSAAALAVAASSSAAPAAPPPVRVLDPDGVNVGALRDVIVWEGARGGRAALIRRIGGRPSAIPGLRRGELIDDPLDTGRFTGLDLGLDRRGRIIATYRFCGPERCGGLRVVDVRSGAERRLRVARPRRCDSVGALARWRTRTAFALGCRGSGRSGVYLARGRHARLVRALPAVRVVDLGPDVLAWATAGGVWVGSPGVPGCRATVVRLPRTANNVDVHVTPGRVWWAFSTAADFGGSEFQYGTAAVGPGCSVSGTRTIDSLPELDWATGTFAVDGPNVFVAGRETGGLVSAPLSSPGNQPGA